MRKITNEACAAFEAGRAFNKGNTQVKDETDGLRLYLHGNMIAIKKLDGTYITNAGLFSNVTKERLNGLEGVSISQKAGIWYLNGKQWDGKLIKIKNY